MQTYRVEVGRNHGIEVRNIVGAIANEAGLDSQFIGRVDIQDDYSTVDLPEGMPKDLFQQLRRVWVGNKQLDISLVTHADDAHKVFPDTPRRGHRTGPSRHRVRNKTKRAIQKHH